MLVRAARGAGTRARARAPAGRSPVNTRVRSSPKGLASSSGFASRLPSAVRRCSTTRSARDTEPEPTASTRSDRMNSAVVRSERTSVFGSSSSRICSLSWRFVRRPGSSCIRARYSSSRASRASFSAPAGNTRTWLRRRMRSVPATRRAKSSGCVGDGRLEAGAALDVGAAWLERGLRELVRELLLRGRPVGAERIETYAAQHESVRGSGGAVSEFQRPVSRLANGHAIRSGRIDRPRH